MQVLWPDGSPASFSPPKPGTGSGFRASSEYGYRTHPVTGERSRKHWGIDLIGLSDGVVKAPFEGIVTVAAYSGGYGNLVEIQAANGDKVRLAHNKSFKVKRGQHVKAGQGVAVWNTTGNSTGTHIHYETIPRGKNAINPRDYMKSHDHPIKPEAGDMSTLKTINKPFEGGQVVTENEAYLRINADGGVSLASGPQTSVWGGLVINLEVLTKPTVAGSTIQIRPVVDTITNGETTDSYSLGYTEFVYTTGQQNGVVVVSPVELEANQRLRFKARTLDKGKVKVISARFRGASVK